MLREDLTANLHRPHWTEYTLDVVLIALPEHTEGYRAMPLFLEPFCFACAPGHPLSNQPVVTESELKPQNACCCSMKDTACATRHWKCVARNSAMA